MIAIHKLCKAFDNKAVLRDFSCTMEDGCVTALMAPSGAGKTTLLRKRLAESTAPKTILIVPEQYTFESEHALLMEYGAETANRVQVYSFTRLAQAAFLQYGGGAGKRLTDGGRRTLMTLALENCADQLTLFEKSA